METVDRFKRELRIYRAILKDPRTPRSAKVFLSMAIGYFVLPFDLIPDFIPIVGHLDDAVIVPGLIALALSRIPSELVDEHRRRVVQ